MDSNITIKQASVDVGKALGVLGKVVLNVAKNTITTVANNVKDKIVTTAQNIKDDFLLGTQTVVSAALSKGINILNNYKDLKIKAKSNINLVKNAITTVPKSFIAGFKQGYNQIIKDYEEKYKKCEQARAINGIKVKNHSNTKLQSKQKINQKSKIARTHKNHKIIIFFKQLIAEMKRRKKLRDLAKSNSIGQNITNINNISNVKVLPNITIKTLNAVGVRRVNNAKNHITKTSATKKEKIKLKSQLKLALNIIAEQTKSKYYDINLHIGQKHKQIKIATKEKINSFTNKIIDTTNEIKNNIQNKIDTYKNKVNTVKSKIVSMPSKTANKIKEKAKSVEQRISLVTQTINVKERLKNSNIMKSDKKVQRTITQKKLEELRNSNSQKLNELQALKEEIEQIKVFASSEKTMTEDIGGMKLSRGYATTPQLIIFSGIIVTIIEVIIIIISIIKH